FGPGEEGKSATLPPGTGLGTPLLSAATQTGVANNRNTTRVPSALHVQNAETDVEATRDDVPRARSSASMLSPLSTSSRRPFGEIRGFEYRPDAEPRASAAPSRPTETTRVSVKPAGANSSVPVDERLSANGPPRIGSTSPAGMIGVAVPSGAPVLGSS